MDQRPTKKQRELLNFIDGFIKGNGYGPSYREIMQALDYKSVSTVATHVNGLIARGWLIKKDNSARTLEVVRQQDSFVEQSIVAKNTTESDIRAKIEVLRGVDNDANARQIQTLLDALEILGFAEVKSTKLA